MGKPKKMAAPFAMPKQKSAIPKAMANPVKLPKPAPLPAMPPVPNQNGPGLQVPPQPAPITGTSNVRLPGFKTGKQKGNF